MYLLNVLSDCSPAFNSCPGQCVRRDVYPLVSMFVCTAERGWNNKSNQSVSLCYAGVRQPGKATLLGPPLSHFQAVYKSGTGTRGQGHRDACVGTWDVGTRDEGLEDIKYGTRGRVGRGRGDVKNREAGDAGCEWLSQKSEVNAISLSSWKCVIYGQH